MSWIVDCSIAMAWCFEDEATERTEAMLDRLETDPAVVPLHWGLEVANVLRSAVRRGRLSDEQAGERLTAPMSLPVRDDSLTHQLAFTSTWQLVRKYGLTSYDAAYLELAMPGCATGDERRGIGGRGAAGWGGGAVGSHGRVRFGGR